MGAENVLNIISEHRVLTETSELALAVCQLLKF